MEQMKSTCTYTLPLQYIFQNMYIHSSDCILVVFFCIYGAVYHSLVWKFVILSNYKVVLLCLAYMVIV